MAVFQTSPLSSKKQLQIHNPLMYINIHYRLGLYIQNDSLQLGVVIYHIFIILPINHWSNNMSLLAGIQHLLLACFSFPTIPSCSVVFSQIRGCQSHFQDNCKFTLVVYLLSLPFGITMEDWSCAVPQMFIPWWWFLSKSLHCLPYILGFNV